MNAAILDAIRLCGGQVALARRCNLSQAAVSKWARGGTVSAENAIAVQSATSGAITVHDLRPDIFGPAPGTPPAVPSPEPQAA